jgi:hypothetical protein
MNRALEKMPPVFTSYDFGKELRDMGVPPEHTVWAVSRFLIKRCDRISKMTWGKINVPKNVAVGSDVLTRALAKMPVTFSSTDFINECVDMGFPYDVLSRTNMVAPFLKDNTHRVSKRIWSKGPLAHLSPVKEVVEPRKTEVAPKAMSETECVDFLKARGYKIMKPVSDWVEL